MYIFSFLPKLTVYLVLSNMLLFGYQVYGQDVDYKYWCKTKAEKRNPSKSFKVPVLLISAGIIAFTDNDILSSEEIKDEREYKLKNFHSPIDDYLQFSPIAATYLLHLFDKAGESNFANSSIKLIKAEILMVAIVHSLKKTTQMVRPDGSALNSFPSGHTAQAFVAATFLHKEFGHKNRLYSLAAYTIASSVGIMRVLNDKHWASDVLVGAGLGILCTNLMYLKKKPQKYHHKRKNPVKELIVSPGFARKQVNLTLTMKL